MFSNSGELHFIDVGKEFLVPKGLRWSNTSDFSLGYSLMCRFQYHGIWKYIAQYKKVVRIDEDCIIKSLPSNIDEILFATGKIEKETHMKTNETLKIKLKAMGMEKFYDHEFPYTNVFIADVPIWMSTPVQNFLATIASDSYCLENRWGDLPVLGVAAKAFGIWKTEPDVKMNIAYFHGSHSLRVNIK